MSDDRYLDPSATPPGMGSVEPSSSIVTTANVVYALHALAVVIGVAGTATVVGSFLFGIPSIVAVIVNYAQRPEARGTFVESHFRWQIRTFWFTLLWVSVCFFLAITIVGIPAALVGSGLTTVWVIYRVVRGWLRLRERRPMYERE